MPLLYLKATLECLVRRGRASRACELSAFRLSSSLTAVHAKASSPAKKMCAEWDNSQALARIYCNVLY
jgi:hypothetical protein